MPPVLSPSDYHTLGVLLIGTGLLITVEPAIMFISLATYNAINRARRDRNIAILWPVGIVMLAWGAMCVLFSIPPRHAAHWCLLMFALPCIAKGIVTMFFSPRLAKLSENVIASAKVRRFKCFVGILLGTALVGWGSLLLFGQTVA